MNQTMRKVRRQEKILLTLDEFNYMTRKQLQIINSLGGDRNAHRILYDMEKDKLIGSIRTDQKIYYISNKGKGYIGSNKQDLAKDKMKHTLMRNDLYIKLGMPADWQKERPVTWGDNKLIPDASFKKAGEFHFVEIDNKQTMATNIDKIKKYKELSHVIFNQFNHTPTVVWYCLSEIRKDKLKKACMETGVKFVIY